MRGIIGALFVLVACGGSEQSVDRWTPPPGGGGENVEASAGPDVEALTALATEAWVYGYPAVYQLDEMVRAAAGEMSFGAPLNTCGAVTRLAQPEDRFVSINNDSMYVVLQGDVGVEPLVLNVPATGARYFVLQFVDAWTNNFAYVGTRATEGRAGKYLLAGPDWEGETPEGVTLLRTPTRHFSIVGRVSVDGARDVRAATRVQEQIWVTPLSVYPERPDAAAREPGDRDFAPYDHDVPETLVFWEKLRAWIALNPPPAAERELLARFEPLGLLVPGPQSPYREATDALQTALARGAETAAARLEEAVQGDLELTENGWQFMLHIFDYNLDYFGIGTIDSDEWKMSDRGEAFMTRALAARVGLWGNHGYEAVYAPIFVDSDGQQLTGENRYELTFETPPPVDAFWSLTMYDHPNYWLVDNEADRYSIGDRTRGLRRGRDGSLTIYMSHEPPPRAQRANWLPAPEGDFRPMLRMYLPKEEVTNGTWTPPAIRRVQAE